jgi:hypothetical protein
LEDADATLEGAGEIFENVCIAGVPKACISTKLALASGASGNCHEGGIFEELARISSIIAAKNRKVLRLSFDKGHCILNASA